MVGLVATRHHLGAHQEVEDVSRFVDVTNLSAIPAPSTIGQAQRFEFVDSTHLACVDRVGIKEECHCSGVGSLLFGRIHPRSLGDQNLLEFGIALQDGGPIVGLRFGLRQLLHFGVAVGNVRGERHGIVAHRLLISRLARIIEERRQSGSCVPRGIGTDFNRQALVGRLGRFAPQRIDGQRHRTGFRHRERQGARHFFAIAEHGEVLLLAVAKLRADSFHPNGQYGSFGRHVVRESDRHFLFKVEHNFILSNDFTTAGVG